MSKSALVAKHYASRRLEHLMRHVGRWLRFFGVKYHCPMCRSSLRLLKPAGLALYPLLEHEVVGGGRRDSAVCPVCGSLDRERLVYLYLTRVVRIEEKPLRLLHVAPEKELTRHLFGLKNLDYLTADLQAHNVMVSMDITDIHYPNNNFDAIICNHVLEHIPDDRRAMNQLWRVLKPGGWAILQVPISKRLATTFEDVSLTSEADRERIFGQKDHVRIYAADYCDRLRSAGFDIEIVRWWDAGGLFGGAGNRYSLLDGEELFIAKKL